jgi:integrase
VYELLQKGEYKVAIEERVERSKIMTLKEIETVLRALYKKEVRDSRSRRNRMIFRVSTFCGLRSCEIAGLRVGDIKGLGGSKPVLEVRKEITKGREGQRRSRSIPLWWDAGTLSDIRQFMVGRKPDEPFVYCGMRGFGTMRPMKVQSVWSRWKIAVKSLGPDRQKQLASHCGRHTFCSLALYRGHSLPSVRDAAGHASVARTSIYLHAFDEDDDIPDLLSVEF